MIFTKYKYHITVYNFPGELLLRLVAGTVMQKRTHINNLRSKRSGELLLYRSRGFEIEESRITAGIERTSGNHS